MRKKIFTSIAFAFIHAVCFCQQNNEFVEVVAQDTIRLDADEIIFSLMIRTDAESSTIIDSTVSGSNRIIRSAYEVISKPETEQEIKKIIAKQKIDTLASGEYELFRDIYPGMAKRQMLLRFSSARQLATFIKEAKIIGNVYGFVVLKKSKQQEHFRQVLTKQILEKAFSDASFIATQSKKSIVQLVQVTEENKNAGIGEWTSYPPLSGLSELEPGLNYNETVSQIILERKLRVKYSWK